MTAQTTRSLAAQLVENAEAVWNDGDLDAADAFFVDDVVVHDVPHQRDYEGLDEFKAWVTEVRTAFPDFETEATSIIVGDGSVVSQWTATGTHEGEMADLDIEPTGETITWEGVTVYTVDDEEVTEAWWYYDLAGMMVQLGVIPEPPARA